jgi:leucyl/phenylalanyl-tRNA--protein transferase
MNPKQESDPKELLRPGNMLRLYASGAFPMAEENGTINWFIPEIRTIIPLDNYNIPRSLKTSLKKSDFEFRYDTDFLSVVKGCADREKTWISEELIEAYKRLQKKGCTGETN